MATRFNISVPKKYTKNGEEKTAWNNVGKLVYFPATADKTEGFILELNWLPDVTFKVFPEKEREQQQAQPAAQAHDANATFDKVVDEISPSIYPSKLCNSKTYLTRTDRRQSTQLPKPCTPSASAKLISPAATASTTAMCT
jgi:hypothetical protein